VELTEIYEIMIYKPRKSQHIREFSPLC